MVGFIVWEKKKCVCQTIMNACEVHQWGQLLKRDSRNMKMGNPEKKCNTKILDPHSVRWQLPIGHHLDGRQSNLAILHFVENGGSVAAND